MPGGRRGTDATGLRSWWARWRGPIDDVLTIVAVGAALYAVAVTQIEGAERRDQTCTIDERTQAEDVYELRQTYDFLADPPPGQEGLAALILPNLPKSEADARLDDAPPFCDERGVGLPEPDPVLPCRPPVLVEQLPANVPPGPAYCAQRPT